LDEKHKADSFNKAEKPTVGRWRELWENFVLRLAREARVRTHGALYRK